MKKEEYIPVYIEQPSIDIVENSNFTINFQRAILLSLVESNKLTQTQFENCMDKVIQKYSNWSNS